jgi:hypothetical protein
LLDEGFLLLDGGLLLRHDARSVRHVQIHACYVN